MYSSILRVFSGVGSSGLNKEIADILVHEWTKERSLMRAHIQSFCSFTEIYNAWANANAVIRTHTRKHTHTEKGETALNILDACTSNLQSQTYAHMCKCTHMIIDTFSCKYSYIYIYIHTYYHLCIYVYLCT